MSEQDLLSEKNPKISQVILIYFHIGSVIESLFPFLIFLRSWLIVIKQKLVTYCHESHEHAAIYNVSYAAAMEVNWHFFKIEYLLKYFFKIDREQTQVWGVCV